MIQKIISWYKYEAKEGTLFRLISRPYRRRLKNTDFTILCSNCSGGVLYHRLGLEFLSPTINLYFTQPDFVYFCYYLDYYLDQELVFNERAMPHPVGILKGDGNEIPSIKIQFNHSNNEKDAAADWNRRKARINRDNMYIMLYNTDGITDEEIKMIEKIPCKNKVIFTSSPLKSVPWSYYIKPNPREKYPSTYLGRNILGVSRLERKFDFVSFLNS